jgi:cobalt-zinc-cadmium efflux system membrane fusion protein
MKYAYLQTVFLRLCVWGTGAGTTSRVWTQLVVLALGGSFTLTGCHSENSSAAENTTGATHVRDGTYVVVPEKSELRRYLVLGDVAKQTVQEPLMAPAVLEADPSKVGNILPPLSGRISALYVHLGDSVKLGQPLFTIDSSDLAQARSDLQHAQVALSLFKKALTRAQDLAAHDQIVAQKDLEQAESDYAGAQSEYERAAAVFSTLGIALKSTESPRQLTVSSPVTGRISILNAVAGTFANDNTAPLMTVSDVSTIWFTASVQEKDLAFVTAGEDVSASVQSFPGEIFKGRVTFVADQLDSDTRTVKVRVAYGNSDGRLKPGMFANVIFLGSPHAAVLVPTTALIQVDATTEVFVEVAPWKFEARPVTAGLHLADQTEVLTGLTAGEHIVVKQGVLLND